MSTESNHSASSTAASNLLPGFVQLYNMTLGICYNGVLYAAARLGIADLLANEAKSADYLADATESHPDALYRLLRTLTSIGVLEETTDRTFQLTPMGELLRDDHPMSIRPWALQNWDAPCCQSWANMMHSIKTGESVFEQIFKKNPFEYAMEHADMMEYMPRAMTSLSNLNCPAVAAGYPFSDFHKIVDIGGGHGALLAHILRKHPSVIGILFDSPEIVQDASEIESDIASRCEMVGGDFFEAVPEGGDVYILQQVLHDWDDEKALKILTNCRKAMGENSRLLVVEVTSTPGDCVLDFNKFIDLHMLLTSNGRERSEAEFRRLFRDAGLELTRVIGTDSVCSYTLIEGMKGNVEA